VKDLLRGIRRRTRRIWNYRLIGRAVSGGRGLEIGGPSAVFSPAAPNVYIPPIYALAASIDNCNFATNTTWSEGDAGRTFQYVEDREPGLQYIHDATALSSIGDGSYDFLLASHILEHVANPLRALEEFHRVLKPKGAVLVLVPNRSHTFDHQRPYTSFAHLAEDRAAGRDETDLTHLEEILALHDLQRDLPAGTPEQFRARCMRNVENRCMHHHVFSIEVLEQALRAKHLRPLYSTDAWAPHLLVFARRV
jgi:SAM-dependent methyltransferase